MSTRSTAGNLFSPLYNPELTIRRRSRVDPTLLNYFEMATEGNGDPPVPDLRTMEELCQPSLNGRGGPIAPIAIQATNFGLKNDMIQQVQNFCQFHRLPGDDANKNLDKFLHVTHRIKVNGVTDDALRLYLFPHSLTHHAPLGLISQVAHDIYDQQGFGSKEILNDQFLSFRNYDFGDEQIMVMILALENQLLSVSMLICLGKHDCVERIPSGNSLPTTLPPNMVDPLLMYFTCI
nr:reverse transcriptase domain-containing protein [Tanacetum cinerariifolium]